MAQNTDYGVVIVGAGIGGLGMAMAFKRKLGFNNLIYERDSDVGGTWRANTYPGCSSDVQIHGYCYSNILKPDWKKSRGSQAEILEYLMDVTDRFDLRRHCVFNTAVAKAEWDDSASIWRVTTMNKKGEVSLVTAKVLVSALGILVQPNFPTIPGADDFKGPQFHSARYRHDIDLHRKKVAVIGNGCSAAQIIPAISEDPVVDVTEYCRTAMWYTPGAHVPYSPFWKQVYATLPFVMRLHRIRTQTQHELGWFLLGFRSKFMRERARQSLTRYITENVPTEYAKRMIPDYAPGCRRIIFDNQYLSSLHRPNVTPIFKGVQRITEDGIIDADGVHRQCDIIIYATGFITDQVTTEIRGRSGKALGNFYEEQGGPTAYLGTTVPDFPNFVLVQGPNTTTGHASVIVTEECQFNYAMQLLEPVLRQDLDTVEPTQEATRRYNDWLSARLSTSVFTQCTSWYRTGGVGKVFSNFPGPLTLFWWLTLAPRWSDYEVQGVRKDAWARRRRIQSILRVLGFSAVILGAPIAAQMAVAIDFRPLGRAWTGLSPLFSWAQV